MKAERERRETILQAEGEKRSQILVAEGEKESAILRAQASKESAILQAEAQKQAAILQAEAEKQSTILRADGVREQKIREAEGESQAIEMVQKAYADALRLLTEANPSDKVIQIKGLEAFSKAADGKATKIIIPSEIQSLAGLVGSLKEVASDK